MKLFSFSRIITSQPDQADDQRLRKRADNYRSFSIIGLVIVISLFSGQMAGAQAANTGWDLSQIIQYATSNNIVVKQRQLDEQSSESTYQQSRASRLPSLSFSASQALNKGTSTDPITYEFVSQTVHSTSASLSASMTLYGGGEINHTIKQNSLLVDQNSLYVQEAKNDIILNVTEAYMEALYYKEGVRIAEENLAASKEQLTYSQAMYDAGSIAAYDLAEVKSQYASDQYTLVTSINSYDQQVLTLKQELELEPEESFDLSFPEESFEANVVIPDKMQVYQQALKILPELKYAELQTQINQMDVFIAKAGYMPTLSLNGSLNTGYTNTQDYSFKDQLNNNYSQRLSVSLSVPIFSKLQNKSAVQTARLSMQSSALEEVSVKKEIYANIETAYQNALAYQSEMAALQAQMEASRTAYELAQQQHNLGMINATDLIADQNDYLVAQQQYVQAKYRTLLYCALLEFYQGEQINL